MKKKNQKKPKLTKKNVLFIRVPDSMANQLSQISKETGASKNFLVESALRHFLVEKYGGLSP